MKDIQIGAELYPGWEVVRNIGGGGFGKVYEVKKTGFEGNDCFHSAMKVISIPNSPDEYKSYRDDGYDDQSITTIFRSQVDDIAAEFKMMSQFKGVTNIVSYEDHAIVQHEDKLGWDVIIRMELLSSLPEYLAQKGISERETVKLGIDICSALELCEQKGIIHRDIKPQNIFVNGFGDYKLGDFGIAKVMTHTTRATKTGTASYMAPEVYANKPYDGKIDQYSLGLLLYYLLNERRLPFLPLPPAVPSSSQSDDAMARRLNGETLPRPKNGNEALAEIVLKACAFDPQDRFATPAEMKKALQGILNFAGQTPICLPNQQKSETPRTTSDSSQSFDDSESTRGIFADSPSKDKEKTQPIILPEDPPLPPEPPVPEPPKPNPTPKPDPDPTPIPEPITKKKKNIWMPIAIGLFVVLGIVIFLLCLRSCDQSESETSSVVESEQSVIEEPSFEESSEEEQSFSESSEGSETESTVPYAITSVEVKEIGKAEYYVGEEIDLSGLILLVHGNDGNDEEITSGYEWKADAFTKAGEYTVKITYQGFETEFKVKVKEASLIELKLVKAPSKNIYFVGEPIDLEGIELNAVYENETVTLDSHAAGLQCSDSVTSADVGTKKQITVTYQGKSVTYEVTVIKTEISSVKVISFPTKKEYYVGDSLDLNGIKLEVKNNDGTYADVKMSDISYDKSLLNTAGTKNIVFSYQGKQAEQVFVIDVKEIVHIVRFQANGGFVSQTSKTLKIGESFGSLPVPTRDYYDFVGWFTSSSGGEQVSSATKMGASDTTVYAHWSQKVVSDWVLISKMPSDAKIVETKWTYRQSATSSSQTMSGYTLDHKERSAWAAEKTSYSDPSNGERNVWVTDESYVASYTHHYVYYHRTNGSLFGHDECASSWTRHQIDLTYTLKYCKEVYGKSSYTGVAHDGDTYALWFLDYEYDAPNYSTRKLYHYQEPIYTYFFYKDTESTTDPTGKEGVSNVAQYVKYRAK